MDQMWTRYTVMGVDQRDVDEDQLDVDQMDVEVDQLDVHQMGENVDWMHEDMDHM